MAVPEIISDVLVRYREKIEAARAEGRAEGYAEGYADGVKAVEMALSLEPESPALDAPRRHARMASEVKSAVPKGRIASANKQYAPPLSRGRTRALVEEAFNKSRDKPLSPTAVQHLVMTEKKINLASTSVRRAIDFLELSEKIRNIPDTKTWVWKE